MLFPIFPVTVSKYFKTSGGTFPSFPPLAPFSVRNYNRLHKCHRDVERFQSKLFDVQLNWAYENYDRVDRLLETGGWSSHSQH